MKVYSKTENCDKANYVTFPQDCRSKIELRIEIENIPTIQSRKNKLDELRNVLKEELTTFAWQIFGEVNFSLCFYLSALQRKDTDKVGDLDNISKPLIDCLCGPDGVLIDDSQIASMEILWLSKDDDLAHNSILLAIDFNNEYCMDRSDISFIQYHGPSCMITALDISNPRDNDALRLIIGMKKKARERLGTLEMGDFYKYCVLPDMTCDFHRTRLRGFEKVIYPYDEQDNANNSMEATKQVADVNK